MSRTANLLAVFALAGNLVVLEGCGARDPAVEQQETIENLVEAGYPASDIEIFDGNVYVQKDALVTLEASREMLGRSSKDEQYRTTNLVGSGVTKICLVPTSTFTKNANMSAGLDKAISNYNALKLQFTLVRGSAPDCSATVTYKTGGQTGGSSGFPSGGQPCGTVTMGTGLNKYSVNVNAHVAMHELGHCIGLRHSDYYNRSISCGTGGNEGDGGVGAILISGTPSTATVGGSVMNACFRSTETGNWTNTDVTALNALY